MTTPSFDRYAFNACQVMSKLQSANPPLWDKLSTRSRIHVGNATHMMESTLAAERSIRTYLEDAEAEVQAGAVSSKYYLTDAPRCSLAGGYQKWVERCYIGSFR